MGPDSVGNPMMRDSARDTDDDERISSRLSATLSRAGRASSVELSDGLIGATRPDRTSGRLWAPSTVATTRELFESDPVLPANPDAMHPESASIAAVRWVEKVMPGGAFALDKVTPTKPNLWQKIIYYKNGLVDNTRNKAIYTRHQSKIEALQHAVMRMHHHLYDVLTCKEAREAAEKAAVQGTRETRVVFGHTTLSDAVDVGKTDEQCGGKTRSVLDLAIEAKHAGFSDRFLEELCLAYKLMDDILVKDGTQDSSTHGTAQHSHRWNRRLKVWVRRSGRENAISELRECSCEGILDVVFGKAKVNDINDMFYICQAPIDRFSERYHYRRNNLLDHVKLVEDKEELEHGGDGKDVQFVNNGGEKRFCCLQCPGCAGNAARHELVSLEQYTRSLCLKLGGCGEDWQGADLQGPKFNHQVEFLQWHINAMDESVTQMRLMGDFVRLGLDNMDQLRFKIVTVAMNVIVTYMVTFGRDFHDFISFNGTDIDTY